MTPDAPVSRFMRERFIRVSPTTALTEVAQTMRSAQVRHLPVVDADRLLGLISHRDLIEVWFKGDASRALEDISAELAATPVAEHMRTEPWWVTPQTPLHEAAGRMLRYRVGCLPVVTEAGGRLVGLITESDLLRAAYAMD